MSQQNCQPNCDEFVGYRHLRCIINDILDRKFQGRGL